MRSVADVVSTASIAAVAESCLHCLMSDDAESVQACVAHCVSGDSLVLLNTAVTILLDKGWNKGLVAGVAVFVLSADGVAHGFTQKSIDWEFIDDSAWVELFLRHRHCLSWK